MSALLELEIEDFTGQIRHRAQADGDMPVSEFLFSAQESLQLPDVDASGRPVIYGARSSRGEALNPSDRLGDVIEPGEVVTLTKNVTAGSLC